MFQWDKSVKAINLPASTVVNLFRSMREVQLALPGVQAQEASAYLCQYQTDAGIATAAVFHLHKSRILAFYISDPQFVPPQKTDSMLDQALNLVESMGFLMTDQDIHLLDDADQEMLWESLPLKDGLQLEEATPVASPPKQSAPQASAEVKVAKPAPAAVKKKSPEPVAAGKPDVTASQGTTPVSAAPSEIPEQADSDNVDDLLAAVEAMRAKRPGLRARKTPPSPEEMDRRRLKLRETVGRILASL